jgi:hypothetical protein
MLSSTILGRYPRTLRVSGRFPDSSELQDTLHVLVSCMFSFRLREETSSVNRAGAAIRRVDPRTAVREKDPFVILDNRELR